MKLISFFLMMCVSGMLSAQKYWNTSAKFDGNSYIAINEPVLKENRAKLTVEFWIKPDVDSSSTTVLGNKQFWVLTERGKIRLLGNGGTVLYSLGLIPGKKWTHVAAVFDGGSGGTSKIYINGVLDNSASYTYSLIAQTDSFYIGKKYFDNFKGEIDEIRIWRVARTADQIKNNMRTHFSSNNLDEIFNYGELAYTQTFESLVADSGLYLQNATLFGNVQGVPLGFQASQTVRHNQSVFFSGTSFSYLESIQAADPDVCFTGEMTVEAWVNPASFDTRMVIFDLTSGGGGFQLATIYDGKLNWTLPPQSATTSSGLLPNTWYHLAVVVDSAVSGMQTARLYVNGNLANTSSHNQLTLNAGKLRLGASHSNGDYFKGYMDEVRISNYAKTQAEIREKMFSPVLLHNQPAAPKSTVVYNFDGNYSSATQKGFRLENMNSTCRLSYSDEPAAPLFSTGTQHENLMKSFHMAYRSLFVPAYGSTMGIVTDTMSIYKSVSIDPKKFKVFLALAHNNINDLKVELKSPTGEIIELVNQVSGVSGKLLTFVIDTQQLYKINQGSFVDYGPKVGFASSFNAYNGKNSKGLWTLIVNDTKLANTGRLFGWGISLNNEPVTGTETVDKQSAFVVYPNPVGSQQSFYIQLADQLKGNVNMQILDINGKLVHSKEIQSAGLQGAHTFSLLPGVYIVKLVSANRVMTELLQVSE